MEDWENVNPASDALAKEFHVLCVSHVSRYSVRSMLLVERELP